MCIRDRPWIKATITPEAARWMRRMHPIRLGYKLLSDRNPLSVPLPVMADAVRKNRHPVSEDNLFKAFETMGSDQLVASLNTMRDVRDSSTEKLFMDIYGQPLLQAAVGLFGDAHVHRRRPGAEPERRRFVEHRQEALREKIAQGSAHEAVMRSLIYVLGGAPATDERNFKRLRASRAELEPGIQLSEFKNLVREQFFILKLDREQALNSLPVLLAGSSNSEIDGYISHLEHVFAASGELSEHAAERFTHIKALFDQARPSEEKVAVAKAKSPATRKAAKPTSSKAKATASAGSPVAKPATSAEKSVTSPSKPAANSVKPSADTNKPAANKPDTSKTESVPEEAAPQETVKTDASAKPSAAKQTPAKTSSEAEQQEKPQVTKPVTKPAAAEEKETQPAVQPTATKEGAKPPGKR
jgi:chemotaxis protein histidine kinase CheA